MPGARILLPGGVRFKVLSAGAAEPAGVLRLPPDVEVLQRRAEAQKKAISALSVEELFDLAGGSLRVSSAQFQFDHAGNMRVSRVILETALEWKRRGILQDSPIELTRTEDGQLVATGRFDNNIWIQDSRPSDGEGFSVIRKGEIRSEAILPEHDEDPKSLSLEELFFSYFPALQPLSLDANPHELTLDKQGTLWVTRHALEQMHQRRKDHHHFPTQSPIHLLLAQDPTQDDRLVATSERTVKIPARDLSPEEREGLFPVEIRGHIVASKGE
jgi:hypothetical protein